MLYLGHDRTWLDQQYNIRAAVPERQLFADEWATRSAEARRQCQSLLDVSYGSASTERLDFFPASSNAPLFMFFHGGYWRANDKQDFSFIAPPLVAADVAFASLNYSLAPAASIDLMVEQARRSIVWCFQHHKDLNIDPTRIFVGGHSAGGHLATMAITTNWSDYGLAVNPIRGICSISGLYELEPLRLCFLNDVLRMDEAVARRNSPSLLLDHVDKTIWSRRQVLFCVGGKETEEFRRQQQAYVEQWAARGLRHKVVHQPDDHHYAVILRLADKDAPLFRATLEMIRTV